MQYVVWCCTISVYYSFLSDCPICWTISRYSPVRSAVGCKRVVHRTLFPRDIVSLQRVVQCVLWCCAVGIGCKTVRHRTLSPRHKIVSVECVVDAVQCNVFHECAVVTPHLLLPPRHITSVQHYNYITTRSLEAPWAKTSSWRPFGPLNFVLPALRALRPCDLCVGDWIVC